MLRTCALAGLIFSAVPGCQVASDSTVEDESRIHLVDQPLGFDGTPGQFRTTALSPSGGALTFTYVAFVDAPIVPSTHVAVQATNFAFDDKYAYIVYNLAGPEVQGALDIVDLTVPGSPKLVSSTSFSTAEFADVAIRGSYAYLVGQRSNGSSANAVVKVVDISKPSSPSEVASMDLAGHYATSIAVQGDTGYVMTGDDGGSATLHLQGQKSTAEPVGALPNALDVLRLEGKTYALGGDKATALYVQENGGAFSPLQTIAKTAVEAPGRMVAVKSNYVATNAGHTGLTVLNVDSNGHGASTVYQATLSGTGNGIAVGNDMAFLAQGEGGTYVYDVSNAASPSQLGHFAFPDDRGSSNEVRFGDLASRQYIFLADGLGGFRILGLTRK